MKTNKHENKTKNKIDKNNEKETLEKKAFVYIFLKNQ